MIKTILGVILIFSICLGCQLPDGNKIFDYRVYNSSFGIFDFGFYEVPQSLEVNQNCEIYVTGTTSKMHDPTDYLFLKFKPDGRLDNSFSDNGHMMFDIDAGIDEGNQVLLTNDNKIIIGGRSNHGVDIGTVLFDYSLAKFNDNGILDKSFGGEGKVITDFGYRDDAINKLIPNDEKTFYAIGRASNGTDDDFAVARYDYDGNLDYSFNNIGRVWIDFGMSDDVAYTAEKTDEGDIIIGGSSNSGATPKVAFAKIKSDGSLDTSFGDNGLKVWKFSPPGLIYDLDINGNDVYASGFIDNLETFNILVTKFNLQGIIDKNFGKNGTKIFSEFDSDSISTSIYIINSNQILLAGTIKNTKNEDAALIMIDNKANLDLSFGNQGVYKFNAGKNEIFTDMKMMNDNLYVIGLHSDEDEGDIILFRMYKQNENSCN